MLNRAITDLLFATTFSVTYSSGILVITDFFIAFSYPTLIKNTLNPLRYMLYYVFGILAFIQCFPNVRWLIIQEEFRNFNFDWKLTGSTLFLIGVCFSIYSFLPSEFVMILFEKNTSIQEIQLRFLCSIPSTIITMGFLETMYFNRETRRILLNELR
jgi:membrane protease YdiL (CAAX protease family)